MIKTFNFSQGYINSYESSCSIGDVASADFNLTVYGNIGKLNSESRTYTPITPQVANASNIVLTTPGLLMLYNLQFKFRFLTRACCHGRRLSEYMPVAS